MRRAWVVAVGLVGAIGFGREAAAGGPGRMFSELVDAFDPQPCGGDGCYTRYLRLADIDGDADLDVLLANGGFAAEPLVVYANDGSAGFEDVSDAAVGGYTGNTWQIAVGDIDDDGDLDIYAPSGSGSVGAMFVNDGSGVFADEADDRLPATAIATESTRFGDLDADGDLDIVVAGNGSAVYVNDGTGVFAELDDAIPNGVGFDVNDIDLFDADRDFDLDLLTNDHGGEDLIWENAGDGTFTATGFSSSGGLHYGPGVCDVDGDGDLDIWIDNQGPDYTERLWRNDGDFDFTDVTEDQVSGNFFSDDNGIVCADIDSDGDFDAMVVALSTPERILINDGDGNFTYVDGAVAGPTDASLWAEIGDLSGDRRLDFATGEGESGSFLDRVYIGTKLVAVDDTAPKIIVTEAPPDDPVEGPDPVVVRFAVSDDAISDHGPRLESAYAVVDPGGAAEVVAATFVGGDIFRVELPTDGPEGTVTYRLCAVDLAENEACSRDASYDVGPGGAETGTGTETGSGSSGSAETSASTTDESSGGTTGDTTVGTETSATATATATATNPSTSSNGGGSSDTGDTDSSGAVDPDGSGCGCSAAPTSVSWWLLPVLFVARRRRRG